MRELQLKNETVRKQLQLLIRSTTSPHAYRTAMRKLGLLLGERIIKLAYRMQRGLVVCTPEDADFIAAGILEALSPSVDQLSFACFWHHRSRPRLSWGSDLDLDVAPIIKRYEEPSRKSLDFIVVVKSIISSGCVVKHNLLDIIDRKQPSEIFVAAPVIYKGADSMLRADFPAQVSGKFRFVYFAKDDHRNNQGIVFPGIGGNVYERLGLSEQKQEVPVIVKTRREQYQGERDCSQSHGEKLEFSRDLRHAYFPSADKSFFSRRALRATKRIQKTH
jgi:hypothetical protein